MTQPDGLEVRIVRSATELEACLAIRRRVFIEEQGVPEALEIDVYDSDPAVVNSALHVLARLAGQPVATGRLLVHEPDGLHIGRVAVLAKERRKGVGRAVMLALQELAKQRGAGSVTLAAQLHAVPFYERLGYVARGPVFLDAGIEHRWMGLDLRAALGDSAPILSQ